jgi:hypothetical protein
MSADIIIFGTCFVIGWILQICYNWIELIWNGMKSGLLWLSRPHKIERRTPNQKRFNTKLSWPQVRWSIARMEHEMFSEESWSHDVKDCVDPACNPNFLRQMRNGQMMHLPPAPNMSGQRKAIPILPAPPPPPPATRFPDPGRTEKR